MVTVFVEELSCTCIILTNLTISITIGIRVLYRCAILIYLVIYIARSRVKTHRRLRPIIPEVRVHPLNIPTRKRVRDKFPLHSTILLLIYPATPRVYAARDTGIRDLPPPVLGPGVGGDVVARIIFFGAGFFPAKARIRGVFEGGEADPELILGRRRRF